MSEDSRIDWAGAMGEMFGIDPVQILKSTQFDWSLRVAAFKQNQKRHEEAMDKNKPKG
jgi:hypothetical protein